MMPQVLVRVGDLVAAIFKLPPYPRPEVFVLDLTPSSFQSLFPLLLPGGLSHGHYAGGESDPLMCGEGDGDLLLDSDLGLPGSCQGVVVGIMY